MLTCNNPHPSVSERVLLLQTYLFFCFRSSGSECHIRRLDAAVTFDLEAENKGTLPVAAVSQ